MFVDSERAWMPRSEWDAVQAKLAALRARVAEATSDAESVRIANRALQARVAELEAAVRAMVLEVTHQTMMRDEYQEWDEFERLAAAALRDAGNKTGTRHE